MRHNVFAYTAPGSNYPEFISVNVDDDKPGVTITVRSKANGDRCGETVDIQLSPAELQKLAHTLFSFACCNAA